MTTIEKKVFTATIGEGSFFIDSRYFPMLITGWVGVLSNALMDRYSEIRAPFTAYADEIGTKIIVLIDTTHMQVPTATVRKYVAEKSMEIDSRAPCMMEYISIMPNTIMRGVATAISWLTGEKGIPSLIRPDFDSALALASKHYEELNISYPRPENYKSPQFK